MLGLISDIHSNFYGLLSVLDRLQECDFILCAGDVTGYYPFVNEVFDVLEENKIIVVRGNHDNYLLRKSFDGLPQLLVNSLVFTKSRITKDNLEKIKRTPNIYRNTFDGIKLEMSHEHDKEHKNVDLFVHGHSHIPSVEYDKGRITINPGSCGQPRDGDLRASCATYHTEEREVRIIRVPYDVARLIESCKENCIHPRFIKALSRKFIK